MIHPKHGFLQHYPFQGGLLEQPAITMEVMKIIRSSYIEYLVEQNERNMKQ